MTRPLRPLQPRLLRSDYAIERRARRTQQTRARALMWSEPRRQPKSPRWEARRLRFWPSPWDVTVLSTFPDNRIGRKHRARMETL